jgi:hypothetical protein
LTTVLFSGLSNVEGVVFLLSQAQTYLLDEGLYELGILKINKV